jgi:serine/threonine protein kinase
MDGTTLADYLARRRPGFNLGCAAARRWARDLLRALAHLHDRDPILMHRDVKPENLLLTAGRPAVLKLADFGLAKMVSKPVTRSQPYEEHDGRGLVEGERSGTVEDGAIA